MSRAAARTDRGIRRSVWRGTTWLSEFGSRDAIVALGVAVVLWLVLTGLPRNASAEHRATGCPSDMVRVGGYCVDRFEASMRDRQSREPLSPFYPPHPVYLVRIRGEWEHLRHLIGPEDARRMPLPDLGAWQQTHRFEPVAQSLRGQVPQGYVSLPMARQACENAGKRLCTAEEWETACRGEQGTDHPYGPRFRRGVCNVYRWLHPAHILHGLSSIGHLDPRLNLLSVDGREPVLGETGHRPACKSTWGDDAVYDMVGNLDEWIDDEAGVFRGGFYARATTSGCGAEVRNHSPVYFDYSTGVRCCRDATVAAGG